MAQQGPATTTPPETGRSGTSLSAGMISALAGAGLLVVFMAQNRQRITVQFLAWDFTWPLWLLILVSAALGSIVWIGAGILRRHRRRKARRAER
jgi:uncharacterized integral membrane protein